MATTPQPTTITCHSMPLRRFSARAHTKWPKKQIKLFDGHELHIYPDAVHTCTSFSSARKRERASGGCAIVVTRGHGSRMRRRRSPEDDSGWWPAGVSLPLPLSDCRRRPQWTPRQQSRAGWPGRSASYHFADEVTPCQPRARPGRRQIPGEIWILHVRRPWRWRGCRRSLDTCGGGASAVPTSCQFGAPMARCFLLLVQYRYSGSCERMRLLA
uniref:Uncharacterized protein n=1 Tax=Oryza brachyantha TaxID=4533 RepID=J3LEN1_ORYBR